MSTTFQTIHSTTANERELSRRLRELCVAEIATRDQDEVCETLGYAQSGLTRRLRDTQWELSVAFRVADLLGLRVVAELLQLQGAS